MIVAHICPFQSKTRPFCNPPKKCISSSASSLHLAAVHRRPTASAFGERPTLSFAHSRRWQSPTTTPTASFPSDAAAHFGTVTDYIRQSIDPVVLGSTASASFKLFLVCAAVGWLLKRGRLPIATASVLSLVSFQLLIPCMLFSRVASTLATAPNATLLVGMALAALVQIIVGGAWGALLAPLVDGRISKKFNIFGWYPMQPRRSALMIASATANATGVPHATAALLPKPAPAPQGLRELIVAASAFGNTFTLPAVFFLSLLPQTLGNTAIAYSGLFLLAWSPCMWSVGLTIVEGGFGYKEKAIAQNDDRNPRMPLRKTGTRDDEGNTASYEASMSQIDVESEGLPSDRCLAAGDERAVDDDDKEASNPYTSRRGLKGENSSQDHLYPALQRVWRILASSFLGSDRNAQNLQRIAGAVVVFLRRVLNPPVLAIIAGAILGLTPFGKELYFMVSGISRSSTASIGDSVRIAQLPPELMLVQSLLRNAYEVIEMLAAGTLGMQTLVLASSLLQRVQGSSNGDGSEGSSSSETSTSSPPGAESSEPTILSAAWKAVAPVDGTEARALFVLSCVRFLLLPVTCLFLWKWFCSIALTTSGPLSGLVHSLSADPLFLFIIAVQSVMPSAQNLIIMLQLSPKTQKAAPAFARMLLKLYAYAVLPVTLWVTAYASRLAVPLV